jgi:hypothetical protein
LKDFPLPARAKASELNPRQRRKKKARTPHNIPRRRRNLFFMDNPPDNFSGIRILLISCIGHNLIKIQFWMAEKGIIRVKGQGEKPS